MHSLPWSSCLYCTTTSGNDSKNSFFQKLVDSKKMLQLLGDQRNNPAIGQVFTAWPGGEAITDAASAMGLNSHIQKTIRFSRKRNCESFGTFRNTKWQLKFDVLMFSKRQNTPRVVAGSITNHTIIYQIWHRELKSEKKLRTTYPFLFLTHF